MNRFIFAIVVFVDVALCANASMTELRLELPKQGELMVQTVDPKGCQRVSVSFDVPVSDIQQIWRPDYQQPFLERKWWMTANTSSMCDMPYMAFFNLAETNRLSFGAEALEWDCRISSKINQEKGV